MAGGAVSRTSLSLAFQRRQNLEWQKLREHLHLQLQQDIERIYTNSLYCDLELVFNSTSIQTHCSILQVRAARFFTKLYPKHPAPHSVFLGDASVDYIKKFIRSLYTKCAVVGEEDAVQYLEELHNPTKVSGDSGLSPESDVYLTPNSSPSEIYHHFNVIQKLSSDNTESESAETLINLQKTNQSYYTIVPVDETFIEESNCSKSLEAGNVLERELAEQDELLKSFNSIRSKEEKKSFVKKISKPTSLPFTSSQYTKKYKRSCDITYARHNKEGKDLLESKLEPPFCNKENFTSSNSSQTVHKDQSNDNLLKINYQKKDKYLVDKFESRENTIQEEEEKDSSKNTVGVLEKSDCVESNNSTSNNDIPEEEEEEFMESPGDGMDCELECCKQKNLTAEDLLNFPCSPEMDASGGGPDSGIDTSSTGCMLGGGLSSPREHTVSETSGVDLTEAAIGEDMPHDGDIEVLLRKPVKSSTSSSVSSDAGTWDSTFPATHLHDTHVTELDCMTGCEVPLEGTGETLRESCDKEKHSARTKTSSDEFVFSYSDEAQTEDVSKMETDSQLDVHHVEEKVHHSEDKLSDESKNGVCAYSKDVHISPENVPSQNINYVSSQSEDHIGGSSRSGPESVVQAISVQHNYSSDKLIESLTLSSEDAHTWKLSNQNNYFINAADLADDSDMLLPPPSGASEQQDKVTNEIDTSELDILQKPSSAASLCEESISSTCDIVNKGITDCLNIRTKYTSTDTLPVQAHTETFCDDVVPFLSSHLAVTAENIIVNKLEPVTESNYKTVNEEATLDPIMNKFTSVRSGSGKHDLQMSSGQDIFAEFQKEIKMIEHLEPQENARKLHGVSKHVDASSSEAVSKGESQSLPVYISSESDKPEIKGTEVLLAGGSLKENGNSPPSEEGSTGVIPSAVSNSKQTDETEPGSGQLGEDKEGETEARRPSLIRRNTFELDPDDDRLALLRQDYERRQGNLLFQSCIPQFSGHRTGSEGFRDAQSLLMATSKDGDFNEAEAHQQSLPVIIPDTSLTETGSYVSNNNEGQAVLSKTLITNPSHLVLSSHVLSNCDVHALDSLNNDRPLDSLFDTHMSHNMLSQQRSESQQFCETVDHGSEYLEETKFVDNTNGKNRSYTQSKHSVYESEKEQDAERTQKGDLKKLSSSFDNSTKPVISGALTCSDIVVEEKRSCDSPKKQKRTESTPIVSGGVSSVDFVAQTRSISDSPIMTRRKTESTPILSGGAPVMIEPAPEKEEVKSSASVASSMKSAWIVDMSDCSSSASKPPLEPRRQKKADVVGNTGHHVEGRVASHHKQSEVKVTALGFFVDLKDKATDCQINKKPRKETVSVRDSESSPGRRNSGVGFFVDLKEQKEPVEKRPVSSEGSELASHIQADEPESVTKNASCGFFINLDKKSVNDHVNENIKLLDSGGGDEKNVSTDKKNTLFSMFIDIGETSVKQESSVDPGRGKVSSPQLSSHKKLGFRRQAEIVSSSDPSQTPESSLTCTDAKDGESAFQDEAEHKKQGFFMFIEAESPVTRRKTLPLGLRPNLNRHSWNLEPHTGEQGDGQHKGNGRRCHKRAHSLSVERGNVCNHSDESRSSSSTSLAKNKVRGSSQSLHEGTTSPNQGSLTQFGDGLQVKEMSSSIHCKQSSKSYDRLPKRALSYEGKSESGKEAPEIDFISEVKVTDENSSLLPESCIESDGADANKTAHQISYPNSRESDRTVDKASNPTHKDVLETQEEKENVCKNNSEPADLHQTEIAEDVLHIDGGHSFVEKCVTVEASVESEVLSKGSCFETESKSLETSFVKLSDLDKESPKTMNTVTDSSDVLPSFATANRMTRSIPETSWIESKLLMTRSIGGGTSTRSLSRLFPHLHTTMTATPSPSNVGRSKSPNAQPDADDNDMQISETSDLSSMQSSMGPSGLEGSTEETDASSSYAGCSGPVSRLGEDLLRMFLEEINPDVTVEVGGRRLKAHKCILSSRCQYFAAMLSGGWVESAGNVISLQGFSYNAVHFALCHIYSGTSNIPDTISIVELATLADMLGLEGLKEVIMYTLKVKYCHFFHKPCTMCAAGVLECLPLAAAYGLDDIYRKSLRWITKYFVRIWPTKGFASLPRELIDKCYQQHVVHMTVDNILETVMCCDKLLATLPNVRWAEPVFGITSQLLESSIKFIANNFCSVLSSDSFLSLGKELSWNISRLEDSLMAATDRLPPDQACQSHTRLHNILTVAQPPEPPPEMQWSPSFVELLRRIQKRVEASLVRQAGRAARCPSWGQMELELRKKIQEAACLVLVPGEEGHRSRHANLAKRGESTGSSSVHCAVPRSVSSSGSRNLDLRQVKLAMTQQARRAASGGRVSILKADTKSRSQTAKKSQSGTHVPPHKAETVSSQAKKVGSDNTEATSRPKTWPLRVLENKTKSVKQRANSSSSSMGTPEKSGAMSRRSGKTMISSSDSSRTSSPAMRRSTSSEASGRGRAATVGNASSRNLVRRSETPPGKEMKSKKKKDNEITAISTDSLSEVQSNGGGRHTTKEVGDSINSRSCVSTRPDTPSVRQKLGEEVVMSTDSLAESVASGEKVLAKFETNASAPNRSLGSTRPDTPPAKERGRKCLGRIGVEVTVSTDFLAATEQSLTGETSTVRKVEVSKAVTIPKSPTSKESQSVNSHFDGSKGNQVKGAKTGETKNEISQPRSPAAAARRVVMRQTIVSPRDSPTFRLRSGITSSPYMGSPSLRRSLLLAARSPINGNAASVNSTGPCTAKPEKAGKSLFSPSTSISANKRTPSRLQSRNQPTASPVRSSTDSGRGVSRACGRDAVRGNTTGKGTANVSKANNNAARKVISNGKNKQNNNEMCTPNKKESSEERQLTVGSRSGTFLKDEPTILKKPDVDNVQE